MTKAVLNNWIMYHEIQKLSNLGFTPARISRYLGIDKRTVKKKLAMSEPEYEAFLAIQQDRPRILSSFEGFVKSRLNEYADTSAAQMHDWLKECFTELPQVSDRTVYNFVMYVRQKHNIPVVASQREYSSIEELPYGQQAQVDFGLYNLRMANGHRKKVWFFAMVLSRSRYKFVLFCDKPFTSKAVCIAHEQAFKFFGGIPAEVVYDQDRTMMVDENLGALLLTSEFAKYIKARGCKHYFCRKADPQTKGKVESVIKYVKKNFLYNRSYSDLEALNEQAMAWLGRTANLLKHHVTKQSPMEAFQIEQTYLTPFKTLLMENKKESEKPYLVRKDHTINYRSNFYSLPVGTYKGPDTYAYVKQMDGQIFICNTEGGHICIHKIPEGTGNKVINNNHRRDHSKSIEQLLQIASEHFSDQQKAYSYLGRIKETYPRYVRDQVQAVLRAVRSGNTAIADKSLAFCMKNQVFNATDFEQVYNVFHLETGEQVKQPGPIKPLDPNSLEKASQEPQKSNLEDYEDIFNQ